MAGCCRTIRFHGTSTVLQKEVDKFAALSHEWWRADGPFYMLHRMNSCRVLYIKQQILLNQHCQQKLHQGNAREVSSQLLPPPQSTFPLQYISMLDVGCGGGILSEVEISCTSTHLVLSYRLIVFGSTGC